MKVYHVSVEQEDEWFVGHVLEREGVTTQGRSLDELVFMVRDAIELMWNEKDVHLELIVPRGTTTAFERRYRKRRVAAKS
jgi:predicted RNase H-like HicB family nuclease